MNKKKIILITILVVVLGVFLLYKFHYFRKYKMDTFYLPFYFKEPINIKTTSVKKPLTYDILSFKNAFPGFKVSEDDKNTFIKKDKKNEIVAYYTIDIHPLFINSLSEESFNVFSYDIENPDAKFYTEETMLKYLNKHNINNDIELIKYIKEKFPFRNNIFTSKETMRNNYLLNLFSYISLFNVRAITVIEGDLNGYIVEYLGANNKDIHIIHKNKQYCINLYGEEITSNEFVKSLIETISFTDGE